ncbi:MAG: Methylamine utilization protein MauG [Gemmatimonadaceae bacterium]|nr:Methylamine utilization protein MauG [Gemmatimonadaceae bacterium]
MLESIVHRRRLRTLLTLSVVATAAACSSDDANPLAATAPVQEAAPSEVAAASIITLGDKIFEDENLSLKRNQSCSSCHDKAWGFTSPNTTVNAGGAVMFGSIRDRFGARKPPSAAYAAQAPILYFDSEDGTYVGGNFWDGRATGARLGNPSAEQALGPFLNPVEQALPDNACVVYRIRYGAYAGIWEGVYGNSIFKINFPPNTDRGCESEGFTVPLSPADRAKVDAEYDRVGIALASYEHSSEVSAFSSKYDAYLNGTATLTPAERLGMSIYEGKANCAACHPNAGKRALMTDYTYDNIGTPANPLNPELIRNPSFKDFGIGGFFGQPSEYGKQKVPTLRNLDKRGVPGGAKAYMHNGVFKTIRQVVHFYNTRDVLPDCATLPAPKFGENCWPAPELTDNLNTDELGNLGLTPQEEGALVAYLKTLNDGYFVPPKRR